MKEVHLSSNFNSISLLGCPTRSFFLRAQPEPSLVGALYTPCWRTPQKPVYSCASVRILSGPPTFIQMKWKGAHPFSYLRSISLYWDVLKAHFFGALRAPHHRIRLCAHRMKGLYRNLLHLCFDANILRGPFLFNYTKWGHPSSTSISLLRCHKSSFFRCALRAHHRLGLLTTA